MRGERQPRFLCKMSGAQFLDTLRDIGYPGTDHLDANSLDWLFENEGILPFMEWFCLNINGANVLQSEQLQQYAELCRSTEGVLEGDRLEEALQTWSDSAQDTVTEAQLRAEVHMLEEEIKLCKERKDCLVQQHNKLSLKQTSLSDQLSKMSRVESTANQDYKNRLEQEQADNNEMNSALSGLSEAVAGVTGLYQNIASGTKAQGHSYQQSIFLSQLDLQAYYNMEDRYGQELKNFTRKQFFEGIADIANEGAASRFEFLEISNPVNLLVRGEREEVNMMECKELARLHAIYPKSECQRINAMVEEKSTQAACQFAEEKVRILRKQPYPSDVKQLSHKLHDAENALSIVSRDLDELGQEEVPGLIKDSAMLQVTKILRGNYNLKIARQDYFTSNQNQLIHDLVVQRSRHEFLTMAYEIEAKTHRDTHKLLAAVSMLLQANLQAFQDRMKLMSDSSLKPSRHQRGTVDSRDKFVTRLYHMLDSENELEEKRQLFLTYSGLEENADKLNHQVSGLRASLKSTNSSQDDRLAVLESNLEACKSMIYSGSATSGGLPQLSPQPILDSITQLNNMLNKLEQAVRDVIKDVENKKRVLKTDPLQSTERELFVYFHCDQDRLRRSIDDIAARLQALRVK